MNAATEQRQAAANRVLRALENLHAVMEGDPPDAGEDDRAKRGAAAVTELRASRDALAVLIGESGVRA